MKIPSQYTIQKFYAYAGYPKYNSSSNVYSAGCPTCHEGKSWKRKRRLTYILEEDFIYCYNCGRAWQPAQWIHEITGLSYDQIRDEINEGDFDTVEMVLQDNTEFQKKINPFTLPMDCINLFDEQQTSFYAQNKTVLDALAFIKERRLDTAINKCDKLWISLKDFIHKNRVIIPFYDPDNQIRFYQSRAIYSKDEDIAKYLSKINAEKTIYGLKNIDPDLDYLFMFEGPIDSMFVKNGLGMTGLRLTEFQKKLLQKYSLFKRIWILDNQPGNSDVARQYSNLIEDGQLVFFWPKRYKKFKDVNEVCVKLGINQINPRFFIENSFSGSEAQLKLAEYEKN